MARQAMRSCLAHITCRDAGVRYRQPEHCAVVFGAFVLTRRTDEKVRYVDDQAEPIPVSESAMHERVTAGARSNNYHRLVGPHRQIQSKHSYRQIPRNASGELVES